MNNLKAKWYNQGYEDARNGLKSNKSLPYYLACYYIKGYNQGKRDYPTKHANTKYKVIGWLFVLAIAAVVYYSNEYLCEGSPIVPIRCKALPWEE